MIRRVIRWNIRLMLHWKSAAYCAAAGVFYGAVAWAELNMLPGQKTLNDIQEAIYGGMGSGEFSLLTLAKAGVYMAVFVRMLADAAQRRDEALRFCASRCGSLKGWTLGELTASLLTAEIWAAEMSCCEVVLALIYRTPLRAGTAIRLQAFAVNVAALYSAALLYAALKPGCKSGGGGVAVSAGERCVVGDLPGGLHPAVRLSVCAADVDTGRRSGDDRGCGRVRRILRRDGGDSYRREKGTEKEAARWNVGTRSFG